MQKITLVAAMDRNNAIGVNNVMPWYIPEDFVFFKNYTMGKPVVMGRKTWESLPNKPLPERHNIIITRNFDYVAKGASVASSLSEAISLCVRDVEICIIGGGEIYRQAMDVATDLRITEVDLEVAGANHFFPEISKQDWKNILSREQETSVKGINFTWTHYTRRQ